jgi:hypothetical protein
LQAALTISLLFGLAGCNRMDIEVINETGRELWLSMNTSLAVDDEPQVQEEVIPEQGAIFEYWGAPAFNGTYDVSIQCSGLYALTTKNITASRKETVTVTFGASDINAFVAQVTNNTGGIVSALYFGEESLRDGDRPGPDWGPLDPGATVDIPLRHGNRGWTVIWYDSNETGYPGTANEVQAAGPGMDVDLTLDL